MFTFKAQSKSNAKRFLVQTAKLPNFEEYLTEHCGQWGTWLGADGQPVPFSSVPCAEVFDPAPAPAAEPAVPSPAPAPAESLPAPVLTGFGAFALAQLTATPSPAPAPKAHREGATPTAGLKIQKDRPEQNGVRRQSAGSVGDKLWALYDAAGPEVTLEQAKALAADAGLSTTSAAIALYNWRKFNGIVHNSK